MREDATARMALSRTGFALGQQAGFDAAIQVQAWYVRAQTGSDSNDGKSPTTALKTKRALLRRLGTPRPFFTVTYVVIFLLEDELTSADNVDFSPFQAGNNNTALFVVGNPTPIYSGTFGTVTALNRSTSSASGLTIADIGGGSGVAGGAQGLLVRDNVTGAIAWVDSVSSTIATCTVPMVSNAPAPPAQPSGFPAESSFGSGHSFTLLAPTKTYFARINPTCQGFATDFSSNVCFVENLWFMDPSGTIGNSTQAMNGQVRSSQCRFDAYVASVPSVMGFDAGSYANCWMPAGGDLVVASYQGGAINTLGVDSVRGCQLQLGSDVLAHGTILMAYSGSVATVDTSSFTNVYLDGSVFLQFNAFAAVESSSNLYGTYSLHVLARSVLLLEDTAANSLKGTCTLRVGFGAGHTTATAVDALVDPEVRHPGRTLTVAALDTPVAGGGFGGRAEGLDMSAIYLQSAV